MEHVTDISHQFNGLVQIINIEWVRVSFSFQVSSWPSFLDLQYVMAMVVYAGLLQLLPSFCALASYFALDGGFFYALLFSVAFLLFNVQFKVLNLYDRGCQCSPGRAAVSRAFCPPRKLGSACPPGRTENLAALIGLATHLTVLTLPLIKTLLKQCWKVSFVSSCYGKDLPFFFFMLKKRRMYN